MDLMKGDVDILWLLKTAEKELQGIRVQSGAFPDWYAITSLLERQKIMVRRTGQYDSLQEREIQIYRVRLQRTRC